jgi:tetratricopeptide (TPR) repeat protein
MALESPDRQYWETAAGYAELGMYLDADVELDRIDPYSRATPEVLAVRVAIYRGLKKWELMRDIAKKLADFEPNDIQWTVSLAYATRRTESIKAAKEILLSAQATFPREAVIPYNLACYESQLGDLRSARKYLKRTFEIDATWRSVALDDPDLKPLGASI